MAEALFWIFCSLLWFFIYRPQMLDWWYTRKMNRADLKRLRAVDCIEDMFDDR